MPRRITISLLCSFASSVAAQETVELPAYTVTASRFESSVLEAPAAVSLADGGMIRDSASETIADTLEDLGVLFRSHTGTPGQTVVDLRGFGEGGNLNTLVLIDGRRVNGPDMSGINWLDLPLLSVGRIEVIRGAQTALYGDNATGGVIKIETEIPEGSGTAGLAGASSWNGRVARAVGWTHLGGLGALVEAGYLEGDGYRENSDHRSRIAKTKLESKADGKGLYWSTNLSAGNTWMLFPGPLGTSQYLEDPRHSFYDENYYSDADTLTGTARIGWLAEDLEFTTDAGINIRKLDWSMGAPAESTLKTANLGPRLRWELNRSMRLTVGGDATLDHLDFERYGDVNREWLVGLAELERISAAVYANYQWAITKSLHVNAAARAQAYELEAAVDQYGKAPVNEDNQGEAVAASLGASWLPTKALRVWMRGDRYFRYPTLDEVTAFQGYELSLPFNSGLEPEEGWGLEAGIDWAAPHVLLRAGAFQQWAEGMIAFDYLQNLNVNLSDADRKGFELSATFAWGDWRAGIQYLQSRVILKGGPYHGKELYLVPDRQITAYLDWLPIERVRLRWIFRHVGSSWQGNDYMNNQERLPGYSITDLTVRFLLSPQLAIYGGVENLQDRKYAALRYSGVWYPGAGRSWRGGIQWEF